MTSRQLVLAAKRAALDKKALDPVILNLRSASAVADYFLVVHGTSDRHVHAIADHVTEAMRERGARAQHVDGLSDGGWVVIDFVDVLVHVFHREKRYFYNLERLWGALETPKKPRSSKRARSHS